MMSMFLKASREFHTDKLDKEYQAEYKRTLQVSGAKTEESREEEGEDLKGESQFLFFPKKSQQIKEEMQKERAVRERLA